MTKLIFTLTLAGTLLAGSAAAQVGIGTFTPDASAMLDITATDKGFLLPRLTEAERNTLPDPAHSLLIYNTTQSKIQINNGSPSAPAWGNLDGSEGTTITSITASGEVSTIATTHEKIAGMELTPAAGNYLVLFNGQFGLRASAPISTVQAVDDLGIAYSSLTALSATNTTHGLIFGNGEVLLPGVYDLGAATSIAGNLTMDAAGDTNALFVIRVTGALTSGAGTTVNLVNGAKASNIFWIADGAISLAANTTMKGTMISNNAAISAATGADLEGRMFSTTGAVSFGPGTAYIPLGTSIIDLGVLESFVMFSVAGAVENTPISVITGDVGANVGAITGFEDLNGNIYSPGLEEAPTNNSVVTFSVFVDNVLVASSSRSTNINTSIMSLQAEVTVVAGATIDIRWYVDTGGVVIGNRILSVLDAN